MDRDRVEEIVGDILEAYEREVIAAVNCRSCNSKADWREFYEAQELCSRAADEGISEILAALSR